MAVEAGRPREPGGCSRRPRARSPGSRWRWRGCSETTPWRAASRCWQAGPEPGDPGVFGVVLGLSTAVPAALALSLTWSAARGPDPTWQAHVSRAAVVVALLIALGGFLQF